MRLPKLSHRRAERCDGLAVRLCNVRRCAGSFDGFFDAVLQLQHDNIDTLRVVVQKRVRLCCQLLILRERGVALLAKIFQRSVDVRDGLLVAPAITRRSLLPRLGQRL